MGTGQRGASGPGGWHGAGAGAGPGMGRLPLHREAWGRPGTRAVLEVPEVQDQVGSVVPAHRKSWGLDRDKAALEFYSLQNFSKEEFERELPSGETAGREFLAAWSQHI